MREFCANVGEGGGDIDWYEGSFSTQARRPTVADALMTAMTDTDGHPTLILQTDNEGTIVRYHQAHESNAESTGEGWTHRTIQFS